MPVIPSKARNLKISQSLRSFEMTTFAGSFAFIVSVIKGGFNL